MNNNTPKKSTFSTILPYILMAVVLFLVIYWIVSAFSSSSLTLYVDQLDSYFFAATSENINSITGTSYTGDYYVMNVTASIGGEVVDVSGAYVGESNGSLSQYSYTVDIPLSRWEDEWAVGEVTEGEEYDTGLYYNDSGVLYHYSYSTLFEKKVAEWKEFCALSAEADSTSNYSGYASSSYSYFTVNSAYDTTWWESWGPTIIWLLIMAVLIFFLFRSFSSIGNSNKQAMDFSKSPARKENETKVKFDDVAGCDEEKAEMVELVEYLKAPEKFSKFGARLPKGVLLIGPPGTGKTLLAKAVAGEAGVPFYSISGSDFVEMFVGVGASRVRDLFRKAKQTAPCLIFIDEIDAVGRQRGAGLGGGNDEREQTLNQLLVEMDGFESNKGILVIAATNRDDVLDPALLRAGRFDRTITVNLPDKKGREAIFKVHARNKTIDPSVDFANLAKRTVGFSGADIENILNEAAILAVREGGTAITLKDIDEAIDRRIAGPAKSGAGMSPDERRQVAYHEAGHAIIGLVLPYSDKVQKITIIPRGRTGGHVLMTPDNDRFLLTKKQIIARITGYLGGRSSEEIFFDDISTGAQNDIEEATRLARLMVTEYGMSSLGPVQYEKDSSNVFLGRDYNNVQRNFSTQVAYEIDTAVRQIVDSAHLEAKRIILEHKAEVALIAETLLEKETITSEEIEALIKDEKLTSVESGKVHQIVVIDKEEAQKEVEGKANGKKATAKKTATKKAASAKKTTTAKKSASTVKKAAPVTEEAAPATEEEAPKAEDTTTPEN